ncbi:YcaO-like family protein [Streptomyces sp. NBC_01460]|uniref:YcaO-like family protein n=1 Tax=Streptomyces sp. NBC_01460 TaxID=2903875 RepID=UPI002E3469CC|nr:YcaO-like family protein [Streptomyces sp. NBC_01460]
MSVSTSRAWAPEVFAPWPHTPGALLARVAARSTAFDATGAGGGASVLIGSAAGVDTTDVGRRARGELMERMGNVLAGRTAEAEAGARAGAGRPRPPASSVGPVRTCDWFTLRRDGVPAVDPGDPATGPVDAAHRGTPAREVRQLWCPGRVTESGEDVWVPAGAAFLQHRPPPGCAATHRAGSTGVAAHGGPDAAAEHAAWEILERDLVRRSWCDPVRHPPVPFDARGALPSGAGELRDLLDRESLRATALALPSPSGAEAVAVSVHGADRAHQTFGAGCGPAHDFPRTVARACWEALMVRWSMSAPVAVRAWDRLSRTGIPRTGLDHALWTFHAQDALKHWIGPATSLRDPPRPAPCTIRDASPLAVLAAHTGREVIAVDRCAGPPADEGLAVVRLIAPGASPLPARPVPGVPPHPFG